MAVKRDYYEILGVGRDAAEDDIRRAFRKLARQYHPDVNKEEEAHARFKEINEAYEVLSDREKRQVYDRFGHDGPQGFAGAGGFGIEDIFETFFGASTRGGGRRPARGADLRYDMEITFEEAVFGTSKQIEIPRTVVCPRCNGNRSEPGSQPERCPQCSGSGEVRRVQQSIFGQFVNVMVCDRCRGAGQVVTNPCVECRGRGETQVTRKLEITIPAGVDEGAQIQLRGEGESGARGGPAGDLYVVLSVGAHPTFKRQGSDVLYDLTVNVAQAALGDEVEVPTVDGTARVKIPAGTQAGRVLRLKDRGVPHLRGHGRGDQQVRVRVAVPQQLTDEQRGLFEALARSFAGDDVRADGKQGSDGKSGKGLFDRVKDVLGGD
jgi:molecular chaperone DnaJ